MLFKMNPAAIDCRIHLMDIRDCTVQKVLELLQIHVQSFGCDQLDIRLWSILEIDAHKIRIQLVDGLGDRLAPVLEEHIECTDLVDDILL